MWNTWYCHLKVRKLYTHGPFDFLPEQYPLQLWRAGLFRSTWFLLFSDCLGSFLILYPSRSSLAEQEGSIRVMLFEFLPRPGSLWHHWCCHHRPLQMKRECISGWRGDEASPLKCLRSPFCRLETFESANISVLTCAGAEFLVKIWQCFWLTDQLAHGFTALGRI